jgi:hypothetical protein
LILDGIEESFVPILLNTNEFLLIGNEFQELLTLSLELALTTILHSGCAMWDDVKIEEVSFDGMIREGKAAKVVSSINGV